MGNVRDEIAKSLLYYRKKRGITQKELAEFLDVKNSAVSNWEKGSNSIDMDTLHKACIALNVSVNEMFGAYSNTKESTFTSTETEFVHKFRKLDERGKAAVTRALEQEYSYIVPEHEKIASANLTHIPDMVQISKNAQIFKEKASQSVISKK